MFLKQIKKIQQIIKEHYLIILIIVLGIILRSLCLKQSLWTDEACSIVLAKNSFNDLIKFTKLDLHPPVYFIILHFWIYFFGDGIKAVRVLSMIIGLFNIFITYLFCLRILNNKKAGLMAGFCYAVSSYAIVFVDTEVRMYVLVTALSLLSSYLLLKAISGNNRNYFWFYSIATLINFYTHYFSFFVFFIQIVYLIWIAYKERLKIDLKWTLIFLLYTPWVALLVRQIKDTGKMFFYKINFFHIVYSFFYEYFGFLDETKLSYAIFGIFIIILLAAVIYIVFSDSKKEKYLLFYLSAFFIPVIISLFLTRYIIKSVYLSYVIPVIFMLIGYFLKKINKYYVTAFILALFFLLNMNLIYKYNKNSYYLKANWKDTVSFIRSNSRPGDLIFFQLSINIYPFNYYYLKDFKGTTNETRKNGAILSRPEKRYIDEGGLKEAGINQFDINYLNCQVLPYKKVWYIYSMADYMDPDKLVLKWFSNNYNLRDSVIFQNWNTTNTITIGEFEKK